MTATDWVFFDGDCLFCQSRVRWLRKHDRDRQFAVAPLQGELAARLLAGTGLLETPAGDGDAGGSGGLRTLVLVVGAQSARPEILIKSRAVAAIAARLPFPWRLGGLLALVPRWLGDAAYDMVARRRHQWGSADFCSLDDKGDAAGRLAR